MPHAPKITAHLKFLELTSISLHLSSLHLADSFRTRLRSPPSKILLSGTSLVVQWLGLWASTAGGMGSIPFRELRSHKLHGERKRKKNPSLTSHRPFIFNWSIVDLQCFVSFRCTAQWFRYIYIYIYVYVFLLFFFLIFWPCHKACRILVPRPGIEPAPPVVEARSLNCQGSPIFFQTIVHYRLL